MDCLEEMDNRDWMAYLVLMDRREKLVFQDLVDRVLLVFLVLKVWTDFLAEMV